MTYRLVALDVDGTTVEVGTPPSERVLRAVRDAQERGIIVALATGRAYESTRGYAETLGVRGPLICLQGAVIREQSADVCPAVFTSALPLAPLERIITFANERGLELTFYTETNLYVQNMLHSRGYYDVWFGIPIRRVPDLGAAARDLHARGVPLIKALFPGEPDALTALAPEVERLAAGEAEVLRSHPMFLEVVPPGVSKGRALAFVADCYKVPQAETIAIGDAHNDISMIEWAGLGVAVANASLPVLAAADWVAPSVEEDGVAVVLERFVLGSDEFQHEGTKTRRTQR